MKVKLEDIPAEGLEVSFEETSFTPQELGAQVSALAGAVEARLRLTPAQGLVRVRGEFAARLELVCSRCLEPFSQTVTGEMELVFLPEPEDSAEEVELDGDDMEVSFFRDNELDLSGALRDELALALPMAPLCAENCTGLCPQCGKPLKEGACECKTGGSDPRWAKLAQLKIN